VTCWSLLRNQSLTVTALGIKAAITIYSCKVAEQASRSKKLKLAGRVWITKNSGIIEQLKRLSCIMWINECLRPSNCIFHQWQAWLFVELPLPNSMYPRKAPAGTANITHPL